MPAQSDECLMLLSRVGKCVRGGESRVFRCKTCLKEFSSFQALGGHRASHTKPASDDKSSLSSGSLTKNKKVKAPTPHLCPICGLDFPIGQALGGHMRKHRSNKASEGALVTHSFLPEDAVVTSSGKTTASLDFGLDSMDSLVNLNLELGRTIY